MKNFVAHLSTVLAVFLTLGPLATWAQASAKIAEGTPVNLRARAEISSAVVKTGETVEFLVTTPVVVNGVTVVAADALARGTVTKARHASGFGRNGELNLSIDSVQAVDGSWIKLRATSENKGANNAALSYGLMLFVSVLGVFVQGHEAVIPVTKTFDVYVNEDRVIAPAGSATPMTGPEATETSASAGETTTAH